MILGSNGTSSSHNCGWMLSSKSIGCVCVNYAKKKLIRSKLSEVGYGRLGFLSGRCVVVLLFAILDQMWNRNLQIH